MVNRTSSTSLRAVRPSPEDSLEVELNELRSHLASLKGKEAEAFKARLDAFEARMLSQTEHRDPGEKIRGDIVRLLSTANAGKPGFLSTPEIEERLGITRSSAHTHITALEKQGRIWIRKTHGANGRPVFYNYHPGAVRAEVPR